MKRSICIFLIIFLISGCTNERKIWKNVKIGTVASLEIPQDWTYSENNNVIYFTDKKMDCSSDYKIYLIGIICEHGQQDSLYEHVAEDMKYKKLISSETLSNSAIFGENEYLINGNTTNRYFLDLYSSDKSIYIIALDESIDFKTIKNIAMSYKTQG